MIFVNSFLLLHHLPVLELRTMQWSWLSKSMAWCEEVCSASSRPDLLNRIPFDQGPSFEKSGSLSGHACLGTLLLRVQFILIFIMRLGFWLIPVLSRIQEVEIYLPW